MRKQDFMEQYMLSEKKTKTHNIILLLESEADFYSRHTLV